MNALITIDEVAASDVAPITYHAGQALDQALMNCQVEVQSAIANGKAVREARDRGDFVLGAPRLQRSAVARYQTAIQRRDALLERIKTLTRLAAP